ncbi:MAG: DUF2723 domain-containing protein [Bacteroidia bacterium]|nr:DUF2723 domain-containing protein [Bacteroidia bacterium]
MKQYNLWNNVCGWVAFLVSAITYILTTEDTASFWDCGEFIATANNLLVGHPPGAPFFMIIGRLFAIMAPDPTLIAKSVNIMSALCSAFTILFLFWTITHLARKIFVDDYVENGSVALWRTISVMGAGMVGALAYTFSDTFWFSAVEGEVYAMSSLFTAVVFWAILKWEVVADEPQANRWLILIAYLIGLSIGVHLLNLLAIPAIGLVYYYKKVQEPTAKGTIIALAISAVVLGVILYGIIPGVVKIASWFELFFVNEMGFGYNSGAVFYALLLVALLIYGIYWSHKNKHVITNTIFTAVTVIIIGYSCFAMIVIRSVSNPTMDENSPEDVFSLMDYLNREQYGNRPLFYGETFASPADYTNDSEGKPIYIQRNGKYEVIDYRPEVKYQANVLFPRMYSNKEPHIQEYKAWTNFEGRPVRVNSREGGTYTVKVPTFWENLKFFIGYQCNFMYWRYFMWNFSGRQNDIQSHGELIHGNWITGIPFIDNAMLGDQDLLPDSLKNNKGRNRYFMLPFLLGLWGLFYQYSKGKKGKQGFLIVLMLFFLTGLAIVLYLNQTPLQPRERDYAYAGSFYAFAIWIGLGVLGLIELLQRAKLPSLPASVVATIISLVCVPCLMAQQNWDDHDRSGSTIARDMAYNYLNSCDENAVIFTNGDNDTFPLWYIQEVEKVRTDVRVCNLSYLQTAWYVDQMKRKAYDSEPLPISFTHEQYTGDRDVVYLFDNYKKSVDLGLALDFIRSEEKATKYIPDLTPERICFLPTKKVHMQVDTAKVAQKGLPCNVDSMPVSFSNSMLIKNDLLVLDMLNTAQWDRPLYVACTVGAENYVSLERYFRLEGLAYRIVPYVDRTPKALKDKRTTLPQLMVGTVSSDKMYDIVMNKFRWGYFNKEGLYIDETKARMIGTMRGQIARLAETLIEEAEYAQTSHKFIMNNEELDLKTFKARSPLEGEYTDEQYIQSFVANKFKMASEVMRKLEEEIPSSAAPQSVYSMTLASSHYRIGEGEKGDALLRELALENWQELNFYLSLDPDRLISVYYDMQRTATIYYRIMSICKQGGRAELMDELDAMYANNMNTLEYLFGEK